MFLKYLCEAVLKGHDEVNKESNSVQLEMYFNMHTRKGRCTKITSLMYCFRRRI